MASPRLVHDEYERGCALPSTPTAVRYLPPSGFLASRVPTQALAAGSVGVLASAVNRLLVSRGREPRAWQIDPERVAASFGGDRMLSIDGAPVSAFAPMSGFFAAGDGWVRTHANYPHHRARLLTALDLPADADPGVLSTRIGELPAQDIEDRCADAGAIAVLVRDETAWAGHPQGVASGDGPLVRTRMTDSRHSGPTPSVADADRPLAGVRVVDLTRVLAGPVAGRDLALLGAQVLRVDPPHLHEIDWQHRDTGQGKRSTLLDLTVADDLSTMRSLLVSTDVLLTGYRPGALDRFGIADSTPGLVVGSVSAWGERGPWAMRRGFDSIVQAASGIALVEGGGRPGALPVQALDHASGHLLAAGVVDAIAQRIGDGCGRVVSVSLARTARLLLDLPGRVAAPVAPRRPSQATAVTHGGIRAARPPLPGYAQYPFPAHDWGADPPHWW
ncbi:CoA transferase [Rhodococcus sp. NPDC058532]|uniref:CoA transferase n=1 Tax=Rhodococcus sp. NPDC058532 TaxID=3346540 RepID=UPI003666A038